MEQITDFEVFREVYESIEFWNKRSFYIDTTQTDQPTDFNIIYTNPNWKNLDTGEKTNEVGIHFTSSDCSLSLSMNSRSETDDEDHWIIEPTGE